MKESTKSFIAGKRAELEAKQVKDQAEYEEHLRQMDRLTERMEARAKLIAGLEEDVPTPKSVEPVRI